MALLSFSSCAEFKSIRESRGNYQQNVVQWEWHFRFWINLLPLWIRQSTKEISVPLNRESHLYSCVHLPQGWPLESCGLFSWCTSYNSQSPPQPKPLLHSLPCPSPPWYFIFISFRTLSHFFLCAGSEGIYDITYLCNTSSWLGKQPGMPL